MRIQAFGMVKPVLAALTALALTLALALPALAQDNRRVALIVGNGSYSALGRLGNPVNDAEDIAAALSGVGYDAILVTDADERALTLALSDFASRANGADIALFYYAGHGLQYRSENYLIPVDAHLDNRFSLQQETLSLSNVMDAMSGARHSVAFIDACRTLPLEGTFLASANERIAVVRGLAPIAAQPNQFIGFSAGPGQTADDGVGRNSPFAGALLEFLAQDVDVEEMFRSVSARVRDATAGRQVPQRWADLDEKLSLRPAGPTTSDESSSPGEEERLYAYAKQIGTIAAYRAFLARFPGGFFAELAKEAIAERENAPPPSTELVVALQSELRRVGCYAGELDGQWGPLSRAALARFNAAKGLGGGGEPSAGAQAVVAAADANVCAASAAPMKLLGDVAPAVPACVVVTVEAGPHDADNAAWDTGKGSEAPDIKINEMTTGARAQCSQTWTCSIVVHPTSGEIQLKLLDDDFDTDELIGEGPCTIAEACTVGLAKVTTGQC
ncbi:MAG: caspase family protein [Devosia sp.]